MARRRRNLVQDVVTEMTDRTHEALEQAEHSAHAAHSGDPMTLRITLSIAVMAVIGASMGSFGEIEAGHTFVGMSEAVLWQAHASDTWNEFQAEGIKSHVYDLGSTLAISPDTAKQLKGEAEREEGKKPALKVTANNDEAHRDAERYDAKHIHYARHLRLTYAELCVHTAVALASVALLMRRLSVWYGALGLTGIGLVIAGVTYIL